jgi:hypothetical protein
MVLISAFRNWTKKLKIGKNIMTLKLDNMNEVAEAMVSPGKGILAADESTGTIGKRFDQINTESTEQNRNAYRDLLFSSDNIQEYISGVIMYDETFHQSSLDADVAYPEYCLKRKVDLDMHFYSALCFQYLFDQIFCQ